MRFTSFSRLKRYRHCTTFGIPHPKFAGRCISSKFGSRLVKGHEADFKFGQSLKQFDKSFAQGISFQLGMNSMNVEPWFQKLEILFVDGFKGNPVLSEQLIHCRQGRRYLQSLECPAVHCRNKRCLPSGITAVAESHTVLYLQGIGGNGAVWCCGSSGATAEDFIENCTCLIELS